MPTMDELLEESKKKIGGTQAPPSSADMEALLQQSEATVRSRATGKEVKTDYEPGVDYSTGAPFHHRLNVYRASGPAEEELYLKNTYGEGNYRKDPGGRWLVRQGETGNWMPVYPKGVEEALRSGLAGVTSQAPTIGGGIGGAIAGAAAFSPLGPPGAALGAVGGAMGGAALGTAGDEFVKYLQGFYDKTPGELGTRIGTEAGLAGAFAGAPMAARAGRYALTRGAAPAMQWWGGVSPESLAVAQTFPEGLKPPIVAIAPSMQRIEWHRQVRNKSSGDPMAGPRLEFVDQQMGDILDRFGITGPAKTQAMKDLMDLQTKLPTTESGEALVTAARRRAAGLEGEEYAQRAIAQREADRSLRELQQTANQPVGELGVDVAGHYQAARRDFSRRMNELYGNIDRITGDMSLVSMRAVRQEARNLMDIMPPDAVPPFIKRIAADETNQPMTFRAAHELRTMLREAADFTPSMEPIGQRSGNVRRMAHEVDNAIRDAQGETGQEAARLLRQADTAYSQGIQQFTNQKINKLVYDTSQGRSPDPNEVAQLLLDTKSMNNVRQVWGVLSPELRTRVRNADLQNMIESSVGYGPDGRRGIDGMKLLKAIDERRELNDFVYGRPFMDELRERARDFAALGGKLDVNAISEPTLIRQALQRAIGARRALDEMMKNDPAMARMALKGNDPDTLSAATALFMEPGNEARTLAGQAMTTPQEWQKVQSYAIRSLFKGAQKADVLGRELKGGYIEDELGQYTRAQQEALFGGPERLANIKLLAQQVKALFPPPIEAGTSFAGGQAAGKLKSEWPASRANIRAQFWGYLADRPILFDMLAGQIRMDPFKARTLMSYLMQHTAYAGSDIAFNEAIERARGGTSSGGDIPGLTAPWPQILGGAGPTLKPPAKQRYGGPI